MVKLCWMKDGVGKKDYYYSFIDSTIYCVRMQEYGQSHGWWSPTLLIYMAGPITSLLAVVMRGKFVFMDSIQFAIIVVSTIVVVLGTHIAYGKDKKSEENYVRCYGHKEEVTKKELRRLYSYGKKYRGGLCIFIIISMLIVVVGITGMNSGSPVGVIIYFLGVLLATIWTELLSPIDQLRIKRIITTER